MKLLGGACLFVCLFASVAASTDPATPHQPVPLVTPPAPPPGETLPDWPAAPVVPQPMPPQPTPQAVASLGADELYVVQSDEDVQLLASPPGVVTVTKEQGPIRIRGKFVGNRIVSTRTYAKKNVFIVERVKAGEVELLLVPAGKVTRRTVGDDSDPIPPPKPKPDPEPKPEPKPDGALGLIKASREGAAKVVSAGKSAEAKALATAQRGVASAVAAGGLAKPADILKAWRDANNAAVPAAAWKPWGEAVSVELSKLYAAGKLPDAKAWAAALEEIAEGLTNG
ncbi:MAG TPA: hypothetical protein VM529_15265 [Gemmata sp.]|nr:hypothetical protein [Gemmata sp.]